MNNFKKNCLMRIPRQPALRSRGTLYFNWRKGEGQEVLRRRLTAFGEPTDGGGAFDSDNTTLLTFNASLPE